MTCPQKDHYVFLSPRDLGVLKVAPSLSGAWVRSKACSSYLEQGTDLKLLFSTRVAAIAAEVGLNLGTWEDGIMDKGKPIPREEMKPSVVFANAWQNVWEWGNAARAYILANEGYKV